MAFFLFVVATKVKQKFSFCKKKERALSLRLFGHDSMIFLMEDSDELQTLIMIFYEQEYAFDGGYEAGDGAVMDIGANIGLACIFFALRFPEKKIIAYEPNIEIIERLSRNTSTFPNITIRNTVVSDIEGRVSFYVSPTRSISSSMSNRGENFIKKEVESTTLDHEIKCLGGSVDIIKFDVEGAEYTLFKASELIGRCRAIVGEIHWDLLPIDTEQFYRLFESRFDKVDIKIGKKRSITAFIRV